MINLGEAIGRGLKKKLQNIERCCYLWFSLNSLHLWNLNGFTFSSFRGVLRVVALEKSNFFAIWRIGEVGFSCISWLISCFDEELHWKFDIWDKALRRCREWNGLGNIIFLSSTYVKLPHKFPLHYDQRRVFRIF